MPFDQTAHPHGARQLPTSGDGWEFGARFRLVSGNLVTPNVCNVLEQSCDPEPHQRALQRALRGVYVPIPFSGPTSERLPSSTSSTSAPRQDVEVQDAGSSRPTSTCRTSTTAPTARPFSTTTTTRLVPVRHGAAHPAELRLARRVLRMRRDAGDERRGEARASRAPRAQVAARGAGHARARGDRVAGDRLGVRRGLRSAEPRGRGSASRRWSPTSRTPTPGTRSPSGSTTRTGWAAPRTGRALSRSTGSAGARTRSGTTTTAATRSSKASPPEVEAWVERGDPTVPLPDLNGVRPGFGDTYTITISDDILAGRTAPATGGSGLRERVRLLRRLHRGARSRGGQGHRPRRDVPRRLLQAAGAGSARTASCPATRRSTPSRGSREREPEVQGLTLDGEPMPEGLRRHPHRPALPRERGGAARGRLQRGGSVRRVHGLRARGDRRSRGGGGRPQARSSRR